MGNCLVTNGIRGEEWVEVTTNRWSGASVHASNRFRVRGRLRARPESLILKKKKKLWCAGVAPASDTQESSHAPYTRHVSLLIKVLLF